MPVTPDSPAPYAPTKAILDIIEKHRSKGLPAPVTAEVLKRSGVSESLVPRTLQALQTLDLVDSQGALTETFEGLRLAPEEEYQARLGQWLTAAYSDVLCYVDPGAATETQIRDAFRSYKPTGQQDRMVTLFIGLHAAAGIGTERAARPRGTQKPRERSGGGTASSQNGVKRQPAAREPTVDTISNANTHPQTTQHGHGKRQLPPLIAALIEALPENNSTWTMEEAADWMQTAAYNFRFAYKLPDILKVDISWRTKDKAPSSD